MLLLTYKEKIENSDKYINSLDQKDDGKRVVKFMLKILSNALNQNIDPNKIEKYFILNQRLEDESKLLIIKNVVKYHEWLECRSYKIIGVFFL